MGQRHQVYLASKHIKHGVTNSNGYTILPFHCQWSYGTLPLRAAFRILNWQKKAYDINKIICVDNRGGYFDWENEEDKVVLKAKSIISLDPSDYSIHSYHDIRGDNDGHSRTDFTIGDNNDGITIIDLDSMTYCFMFLSTSEHDYKVLQPITAREYLNVYYTQESEQWKQFKCDQLIKKFNKFKLMPIEQVRELFLEIANQI